MSTTDQQNEFIQSLNGELTPDQAAQLLEMGIQGDTGVPALDLSAKPGADADSGKQATTSDNTDTTGKAPTADLETGKQEEGAAKAATPPESELTPENAVILAKDGKHTIGFERLLEARQQRDAYKAQAEAAERQLAELKAQAKARADAGEAPTSTDDQVAAAQAAIDRGVDPEVFGDFSEEAIAKGIQSLIERGLATVESRISKALEPIQASQQSNAEAAHFRAIYDAHPDADSIVESEEMTAWMASKPSFVRNALESVLEQGSAAQVIELFTEFKKETGAARREADQEAASAASVDEASVREAAKKAIESAKPTLPASLTDFPGGRAAGLTREEQMAQLNGRELLDAMQAGNMSPEQIERFLNTL